MANVTIRGLMLERDRLLAIIEEAKTAKASLALLNKLIASYGGTAVDDFDAEELRCDICGQNGFTRKNGLGMHKFRMHGIRSESRIAREAATKRARKKVSAT